MRATEATIQFLSGLDYPISKAEILRAATEAELADPIRQSLGKLLDRQYEDAEDVTQTLNATS